MLLQYDHSFLCSLSNYSLCRQIGLGGKRQNPRVCRLTQGGDVVSRMLVFATEGRGAAATSENLHQ